MTVKRRNHGRNRKGECILWISSAGWPSRAGLAGGLCYHQLHTQNLTYVSLHRTRARWHKHHVRRLHRPLPQASSESAPVSLWLLVPLMTRLPRHRDKAIKRFMVKNIVDNSSK